MAGSTANVPASCGTGGGRIMSEGPDFLCIGLLEAGTTWLYDQLRNHDAFWMPPLKELHFLDGEYPSKGLQAKVKRFGIAPEGTYDARDAAFFAQVQEHPDPTADLDFYASLFAPKAGLLSGDITPRYGALAEEQIAAIAAHFPRLRIAVMVRDPVARLWAQTARAASAIEHHKARLTDVAAYAPWATGPIFAPFSYPSQMVERWRRHFPKDQLHVFFYEDLLSRPEWLRDKIIRFIGGTKAVPGARLPATYASNDPAPPEPAHRDALVSSLGEEVVAAAKLFGEHAKSWPALYGLATPSRGKAAGTKAATKPKTTRSRKKVAG